MNVTLNFSFFAFFCAFFLVASLSRLASWSSGLYPSGICALVVRVLLGTSIGNERQADLIYDNVSDFTMSTDHIML